MVDAVPGLWVSSLLSETDPPPYDFMMRFVDDNELQLIDAERPATYPVFTG